MKTSVQSMVAKLQNLEKEIEFFEFSRIPITKEQIETLENTHQIRINPDIKEIFTTVGCTYWSFNDMNWDWIVESNKVWRKDFRDSKRANILKNGFVFSDDEAGNPILVNEKGELYIFYHDDIGYEKLEKTIPELMESVLQSLTNYKEGK